jgi:predicted transcriptional regulator
MGRILKHKTQSKTMSQNPTLTEGCGEQSSPLINGFKAIEDVLTFMKQQERRIEKLEEKNKELEDENKELEEFIKKKCESEWSDWCAGGRDDP